MREARMSEFFSFATLLTKPLIHSLTNFGENGAPTRNCTRLACVPSRRIADNALGASKMVGARRLARPRLPDSKSGGSAIPREPRADEIGVPDRLRSGDLLHERQACWLDYTTGTEMERVNGIAPLSRPWHGRILLLNHTRKQMVSP